jgi:hypothetical protein
MRVTVRSNQKMRGKCPETLSEKHRVAPIPLSTEKIMIRLLIRRSTFPKPVLVARV